MKRDKIQDQKRLNRLKVLKAMYSYNRVIVASLDNQIKNLEIILNKKS